MSLPEKLAYLFQANKPGDWFLQDDGNGPYILRWNRAEPQPTQQQLDDCAIPAAAHAGKAVIQMQITAREKEMMLPRPIRDYLLGSMEEKAAAIGAARTPPLTKEQSIEAMRVGNAGYRKVKEFDDELALLRAKL